MSSKGIVVIGPVFVDIKGYPYTAFIPRGRNAGRVEQKHGGVSRNVAEDLANMELNPTYICAVDDTGTGTDVLERLRKHGTNVEYIRRAHDAMGIWLAIFDNDGDVLSSISKRPDIDAIRSILDEKGDEIISQCDSLSIEIDFDKDVVERCFELAEKYNKDVYAIVSNINIAIERRGFLRKAAGFVCNQQEAGLFFAENYDDKTPEEMVDILKEKIKQAKLKRMVVTMGGQGSVYADENGDCGIVPAQKVDLIDSTGAGDSFFAGVVAGLTYGKTLEEACVIGTRLAASVISTEENVCPRFHCEEFGISKIH